jgi:hypothetical protein
MTKDDKPKELDIIGKVLDFINQLFPQELKKAKKEFDKTQEVKIVNTEREYYRGFLAYFLIKRTINGATPMEYAYTSHMNYFKREEKQIIKNFIEYVDSLFEIKQINKNKKDFLLQNVIDKKEYLVKTIDFPTNILSEEDFIRTLIVRRKLTEYFFYGNVSAYNPKEGRALKKSICSKLKEMPTKNVPEIKWTIIKVASH